MCNFREETARLITPYDSKREHELSLYRLQQKVCPCLSAFLGLGSTESRPPNIIATHRTAA
jgi:hypothetical protein